MMKKEESGIQLTKKAKKKEKEGKYVTYLVGNKPKEKEQKEVKPLFSNKVDINPDEMLEKLKKNQHKEEEREPDFNAFNVGNIYHTDGNKKKKKSGKPQDFSGKLGFK